MMGPEGKRIRKHLYTRFPGTKLGGRVYKKSNEFDGHRCALVMIP